MLTRDTYTGKSYEIKYRGDANGGALLIKNNGDVDLAIVPPWCAELAREAEKEGDVILAEAIIKKLRLC